MNKNTASDERLLNVEEWAECRLNEVFEKENFEALGKENDRLFQALVFMQRASSEISKAYTIVKDIDGVGNEELEKVIRSLQKLIEKTRSTKENKD